MDEALMKKIFWLVYLLLINISFASTHHVTIGAANIEDTQIQGGAYVDDNFGSCTTLFATLQDRPLIRVTGVATALGADATITACCCSLYCTANGEDGFYSVYRVFKPWGEGIKCEDDVDDNSATWADWACDAMEWGSAGCSRGNDNGSDNNTDGGGYDRTATAMDVVEVSEADTWYVFDISVALAQAWYDSTANEEGVILIGGAAAQNDFASTENATESLRPRFSFTFTTPDENNNEWVNGKWNIKQWGTDRWSQ